MVEEEEGETVRSSGELVSLEDKQEIINQNPTGLQISTKKLCSYYGGKYQYSSLGVSFRIIAG